MTAAVQLQPDRCMMHEVEKPSLICSTGYSLAMRRLPLIGFLLFAVILIVGLIFGHGNHHQTKTSTHSAPLSTTIAAVPTTTPAVTGPPTSFIAPGATKPTKLAKPGNSKATRGVDPQDHDPALIAAEAAQQRQQPAFQFLPFTGKTITADVTNTTPTGLIVIEVVYRGSVQKAINEWRNFLTAHHDPGTKYQVYYLPAKSVPANGS